MPKIQGYVISPYGGVECSDPIEAVGFEMFEELVESLQPFGYILSDKPLIISYGD